MAPFNFFKKKEEEQPTEQSVISLPQGESLSIQEAHELLQQFESANIRTLSTRLTPVKASVDHSLKIIGALAVDMENEKIKLEDLEQKFKSVVENSRKTVVSSLKREASIELELPESVNDVKKFKEKFEALMKRLGEVSGSHSKILKTFMKKNATRMRDEFENLEELLTRAKSIISSFDQKRAPLVKCSGFLNSASQKVASLNSAVLNAETLLKENSALQEEIEKMKAELDSLKASSGYKEAQSLAQQLENAELQQEDLRNKLREPFSHISRAFTKYSYGVSRETEARLNLMSSEPWKLLDMPDTSAYSALLAEVRKSISTGKIQLKDSDRTIQYLDSITGSLPDFQLKARQLAAELSSLHKQDISIFQRAGELKHRITERTEQLSRSRDSLELLMRQNEERKGEVGSLLGEASELLSAEAGKRFSLRY